ncbi:30S ribosomal protein S20 [Candidatus Beckwithbacteria bacterium]|nr:30S ribosomal protein S20 [Candidatus Beckwithbacteria bacterium]
MPIIKSAKKALRQSKRRASFNKPVKSKAKTMLKKAYQTPTKENLSEAFSSLDKAIKRKLFHKNKVARLKSQLAKLNQATTPKNSDKKTAKKA